MRIDNLHLTVMRGITYREGGVTTRTCSSSGRGSSGRCPTMTTSGRSRFSRLPPEAYEEENALSPGCSCHRHQPVHLRLGSQTVDQNTATGVTALQEVASRLLRFKAGQIQYKGYQRSFEMWGAMTQQFLDRNMAMEIVGDDGRAQWVQYSARRTLSGISPTTSKAPRSRCHGSRSAAKRLLC
jgi:hypothetical protein